MFLQTVVSSANMQRIALIINTVLLIALLITIELAYSDQSKEKRKPLYLFAPLVLILVGLLIFAAYKQQAGA